MRCFAVPGEVLRNGGIVSGGASVPPLGLYTLSMKGLREFIDWLRETLQGAPQPQPVPVPVRVREPRRR